MGRDVGRAGRRAAELGEHDEAADRQQQRRDEKPAYALQRPSLGMQDVRACRRQEDRVDDERRKEERDLGKDGANHRSRIPVSYTHLDVYKRQARTVIRLSSTTPMMSASATNEEDVMAIEPGDVVILKSGGQPMTVASVDEDNVECLWLGEEGELFRETIPSIALAAYADAIADDEDLDVEDEDDEEEHGKADHEDEEEDEEDEEEERQSKGKRRSA